LKTVSDQQLRRNRLRDMHLLGDNLRRSLVVNTHYLTRGAGGLVGPPLLHELDGDLLSGRLINEDFVAASSHSKIVLQIFQRLR
jgi:hypothetical protein